MNLESVSPLAMLHSFARNRHLIFELARREVVGRYKGSAIGMCWALFNPLLMLGVYTFVFMGVFNTRWSEGAHAGTAGFAVILFTGMLVHGLFAECLTKAPLLIVSNANFVKKVVFPLEILPVVSTLAALFHALVSLLVVLVANLVVSGSLSATTPLVLLIIAPLVLACLGVSWICASLGVFLRDVNQVTGVISSVLMFISPVFYPTSSLPENVRFLFNINPLTYPIEQARKVLLAGEVPEWGGLALYWIGACFLAWFGFWWFQRTRKAFADVL